MTLDEIYNTANPSDRVSLLYQMLIVACGELNIPVPTNPLLFSQTKVLAAAIATASSKTKIEVVKAIRKSVLQIGDEFNVVVDSGLHQAVTLCDNIFPNGLYTISQDEVEQVFKVRPHILKTVFP